MSWGVIGDQAFKNHRATEKEKRFVATTFSSLFSEEEEEKEESKEPLFFYI
jgi:hypothetical protein